jgi:hypothetical protein
MRERHGWAGRRRQTQSRSRFAAGPTAAALDLQGVLIVKLTELDPHFLKCTEPLGFDHADEIEDLAEAEGLMFLCPTCFRANKGATGTHSIIVWRPTVSRDVFPGPGRWDFVGTGYHDLSLKAGSSSVQITGGCRAHFFVRNGRIDFC